MFEKKIKKTKEQMQEKKDWQIIREILARNPEIPKKGIFANVQLPDGPTEAVVNTLFFTRPLFAIGRTVYLILKILNKQKMEEKKKHELIKILKDIRSRYDTEKVRE